MILLILVVLVAYLGYIFFLKPTLYWTKRGIFYVNVWVNYKHAFFNNKSIFETMIDSYAEYPDKRYYGSYQFLRPSLFVRDVDLIKRITVKDFDHFPDRLNFISEKADPVLGYNLFNLQGEKWRDMRATLSPAFTSAKMRSMYTLMQKTAEHFVEYFYINDDDVIELEMKNVFSRYTNDVIANCAFGIKIDSLKDQTNEFYTMGTEVMTPRAKNVLRGTLAVFFPTIFEFFKIPVFPPTILNFFRNIITETMAFREEKSVIRPDMIHLLMEARKGRLKHETDKNTEKETGFATAEESSVEKSGVKMELTDNVITAQALVFFLAGFDTSSTLLSFLSYELALNPDVQSKLQEEVDKATKGESVTVSYEEILKMKYLDQVISEALRKYPPAFLLSRLCVKDYLIEAEREDEFDFLLEKDCLVTIPVVGIHMDEKYFPEPKRFNPDRFSDENKDKIVPGSYMPFGIGPRNCIGSRFALLEAKVLVVSLLSRFDIVPVKRTKIPIELAKSMQLSVKDGFWLGFKKRNKH